MGQACSKSLNEDNRASRNDAMHPSGDAELLFLVTFENAKHGDEASEPLEPEAPRPSEKRLRTGISSPAPCNVHAGKTQTESTNQLTWLCSVSPSDAIPAGGRIYVVRKVKLPDDRVQSATVKVPEPMKVFNVTKAGPKKPKEVTDFGQTKPLKKSNISPAQGMYKTPGSIRSIVLGQSGSQALKNTLPSQSERRVLSQTQVAKMACRDAYIKQLMARMGSKCIQERISAIDQLVADCTLKPDIVMSCIFLVFDTIRARLVESNRMVNLHMLKALGTIIPQMKESLPKVVSLLIPAIVDNHLNSKTNAIYSTALAAIRSVVHNLDNSLLLEMLVFKAQLIRGNAKTDLADTVAGMAMELYPLRPKMVEQQVPPLLWHMLSVSSRSPATVTLFKALYRLMGPKLWAAASWQPHCIQKGLHHLLSSASVMGSRDAKRT